MRSLFEKILLEKFQDTDYSEWICDGFQAFVIVLIGIVGLPFAIIGYLLQNGKMK